MRIDFPEFEKLNERARKERAEAVYRLFADIGNWIRSHATRTHSAHPRSDRGAAA